MLPFLKAKKQASVASSIIKNRTLSNTNESEDLETGYSIKDCVMNLIVAIHTKDIEATTQALKDVFQKLKQEPSNEVEHVEPHSYEAQNIKAAQGTGEY